MSASSTDDLRRQASQQLLQVDFGIGVNRGQFFLQGRGIGAGVAAHFSKSSQQTDGLDDFFFLQGHDAARPGSAARDRDCTATAALYRRAGIRNAAHRDAASGDAAALRAFRGRNQLQKFLRIIKPLLEFRAQRLGRNLGRNADLAGRRIGSDKPYFVDADRSRLAVPEGALDLFDDVLGPGSAHGESPHQLDEFVLGDLV